MLTLRLTLLSQLNRQFSLAQYLYNNISEEDKERLLFDPDTGRWSGYKHPFGFKKHRGPVDGIEQFNWYPREWNDLRRIPTCLHPFMDEIEAFCNVRSSPPPSFGRLLILNPVTSHSTSPSPSTAGFWPSSRVSSSCLTTTFGTRSSRTAPRPARGISDTPSSDLSSSLRRRPPKD